MSNRKRYESFQDHKARLYPELHSSTNGERVLSRTVTFQVTDACNLACKYCYQINKGHRQMSFETGKKFIDLIFDEEKNSGYVTLEKSPFIVLDFIGGEPLLEIDLIDKLVDYFIEKAFEMEHPWSYRYCISLCSNGVLYFEPNVQKFFNKHRGHLSLSITIDGNKELHDSCRIFPDGRPSYDLAVAAAKDWMDNKKGYMGSKITIAPSNVQYLNEALHHMIDLGYDEINANCVYEEGWELEHAQELYRQMKDFSDYLLENDKEKEIYCSLYEDSFFQPKDVEDTDTWCGGTNSLMLSCDPDGWLFPCIRYMESSLGDEREPVRIGHVDYGIYKTSEELQIQRCMDCVTRRSQTTDKCFYCPIAAGCSDCAAYNYQVHGTVHSKATFICIMHQARALANVYFWNKLYQKNDEDKKMLCYIPKDWAIPIIGEDEYKMLIELSGGQPGINPHEEEFKKGCEEDEIKIGFD